MKWKERGRNEIAASLFQKQVNNKPELGESRQVCASFHLYIYIGFCRSRFDSNVSTSRDSFQYSAHPLRGEYKGRLHLIHPPTHPRRFRSRFADR